MKAELPGMEESDIPVKAEKVDSERRPNRVLSATTKSTERPPFTLIGKCRAMETTRRLVSKVAPTNATVFITGETGTGKDVVAQMVHELSSRREGPYIAVNCAAICESLVDSEIFGHEKGSFTSAQQKHLGYFEQASGGTLFLDEIAEMPKYLQAKLLRALEDRTIRRVGGTEDITVDVRFIAAASCTSRDVLERDTLRRDLYYRLSEFTIELPPLRERGSDILALANHFVEGLNEESSRAKFLTSKCVEYLRGCDWPGNVRELKHKIRRAFTVADGEQITREHFSELPSLCSDRLARGGKRSGSRLNGNGDDNRTDDMRLAVGMSVREAEQLLISATLGECPDKARAAELLGISLRTLYNRLKEYNGNETQTNGKTRRD